MEVARRKRNYAKGKGNIGEKITMAHTFKG